MAMVDVGQQIEACRTNFDVYHISIHACGTKIEAHGLEFKVCAMTLVLGYTNFFFGATLLLMVVSHNQLLVTPRFMACNDHPRVTQQNISGSVGKGVGYQQHPSFEQIVGTHRRAKST